MSQRVGVWSSLLMLFAWSCDSGAGACTQAGAVLGDDGLCRCPPGTTLETEPDRCEDDARERGDGGDDAGHDAGVSQDASPGPSVERDASQESEPPLDAAPGSGGQPRDAETASEPDAGPASMPSDGGRDAAPFACAPSGRWYVVYTEYMDGTCGSPTANGVAAEWYFNGKLSSPLEHCQTFLDPSADGCKLDYDQYCTFPDDVNVVEHEMGSWEMVSPTEIVGTARIERIDPTRGGNICRSRLNVHAIQ